MDIEEIRPLYTGIERGCETSMGRGKGTGHYIRGGGGV